MKADKTTENPYICAECLNVRTPLCNACNQIKSPSGRYSKPTYYQSANKNSLSSKELALVTYRISTMIATGNPIFLADVISYNTLLTKDKE